jgi:hypothetical protein
MARRVRVADSTIECAHSCRPPLRPRARLRIDAHSDPSGENPTGSASFVSLDFGLVLASGPVTRLEVVGNSAIVGFDDDGSDAHYVVQVVDNSAAGTSDLVAGPVSNVAGCSFGSGIPVYSAFGAFVVHDALPLTSKDQCKDRGWRDFTDDEGQSVREPGRLRRLRGARHPIGPSMERE